MYLQLTLAMRCRQCLPLSVVQLKGKHCRIPHCRNGVVDTFRPGLGNWTNKAPISNVRPYSCTTKLLPPANDSFIKIGVAWKVVQFLFSSILPKIDSTIICKLFSDHVVTHYMGCTDFWNTVYMTFMGLPFHAAMYLVSEQPKEGDIVKHHPSIYRTEILHTFPN